MQPADVAESFADDIEPARRDLGFEPTATIETGLASFVRWYGLS
jgi:nucleoside-diphosphate-sugar epimerase